LSGAGVLAGGLSWPGAVRADGTVSMRAVKAMRSDRSEGRNMVPPHRWSWWIAEGALFEDLAVGLHREPHGADQGDPRLSAEAVAELDQRLRGDLAIEDVAPESAPHAGRGPIGAVVGPEAVPVGRGPGQSAGERRLPGLVLGQGPVRGHQDER